MSGFVKRNHVSIWNWIQRYKPEKISHTKRRIYEFIFNETLIKVGGEFAWSGIASKPKDKTILGIIYHMKEVLIDEHFMDFLSKETWKNVLSLLMVVHGIHKHVDS